MEAHAWMTQYPSQGGWLLIETFHGKLASFIFQFTLLARRGPFVLSLSKDVNPHRSPFNKQPFDKLRANGESDV